MAPVTYDGEQLASAEISQATGAGGNTNTITVTFTPFAGALKYKVYLGTSTGETFLVKEVAGKTYDANGTITGNISSIVIDAPSAGSEITAKMAQDRPLVGSIASGDVPEKIMLWDLDPIQGLGKVPYTNSGGSRFNGLVTINPLAETDDNLPFLVKSYLAMADSFEATSFLHRGLKVSA